MAYVSGRLENKMSNSLFSQWLVHSLVNMNTSLRLHTPWLLINYTSILVGLNWVIRLDNKKGFLYINLSIYYWNIYISVGPINFCRFFVDTCRPILHVGHSIDPLVECINLIISTLLNFELFYGTRYSLLIHFHSTDTHCSLYSYSLMLQHVMCATELNGNLKNWANIPYLHFFINPSFFQIERIIYLSWRQEWESHYIGSSI